MGLFKNRAAIVEIILWEHRNPIVEYGSTFIKLLLIFQTKFLNRADFSIKPEIL